MEINKIYRIGVSEPWNFTSTEGENVFTVKLMEYIKDKKGEECFLMKVKVPFHMKRLIRDEIVKDSTLLSGKYKKVEEYQDLKVEYIMARYRNKSVMFPTLNISYIPNEFINRFNDIDSIMDKLIFIIIGSVEEIS